MMNAMVLKVQPLTREAFAPFGDVIEVAGARSFPINGGTCMRFDDLARIDVTTQEGHAALSVFRGQPVQFPVPIIEVERHPLGSQSFTPVGVFAFLIVVAENGPQDEPGEPHAFLSDGWQGVNYARGVWHHPLLSLVQVSDFLVVDRAGPGANCDVATLSQPYVIESAGF
jgi:ureidoglycolate lyase